MYRVVIILCLGAIVRSQIPSLGFCPEYLPMADFDMERFLGKWYEAERYFQITEVASRCVVTDYAKAASGKIYVSNEVTNRLTGIKRVIDGTVELTGREGEGKINVKYSTTPISTESQLTVLDTDYDNYAVVWSCNGFGPIHAESVWVMTRDRLAPGQIMQQAYGVLDKYKISRNFFIKTDQEGCAVAASDINAANGITSISTVAEALGNPQRNILLVGNQDNAVQSDTEQAEVNEVKPQRVTEQVAHSVVQSITQDLAQNVAQNVAQQVVKDVAQDVAQQVVKDVAQDVAQQVVKDVSQNVAQDVAQNVVQEVVAQNVAQEVVAQNVADAVSQSVSTECDSQKVTTEKGDIKIEEVLPSEDQSNEKEDKIEQEGLKQ